MGFFLRFFYNLDWFKQDHVNNSLPRPVEGPPTVGLFSRG